MISCIFEALQASYAGSSITLIKKLMDDGLFTAEDVSATGIVDLLHAAGIIELPFKSVRWQQTVELSPGFGGGFFQYKLALPTTYYNRQKVIDYKFSTPPDRFYWEDGILFAEFAYKRYTENFAIEIEAGIISYKYDLLTARNNSFALSLSEDEKWFYTQETNLFEISNPTIKEIASEANGQTSLEIAKDMCRIVANQLYEETIAEEKSALTVLNRGYGDCWDYSVLYTALCRARDIPARMAGVKTSFDNVNENHMVVEIYIDNLGWIPIDPRNVANESFSFDNLGDEFFVYFTSKVRPDFLKEWDYHGTYDLYVYNNCTAQFNNIIYQYD